MYALADCNNFFVSCERVFRPELNGKPVVVLSNNDACIIARSNEVKKLGIPMGEPVFKVRELLKQHRITACSSNYVLYGDMSRRIMSTLQRFSPEIEIYSIDEAFLNLSSVAPHYLTEYIREIARYTTRATGIPVSIGVASTKTLAKAANHYAKHHPETRNVWIIQDESSRIRLLRNTEISEVWGIGRRLTRFLNQKNIFSAYDLSQQSALWVRRHLTVTGLRTWEELHGHSCINLEDDHAAKKQICTSRCFGEYLSAYEPISEAVATFATRCAEKLRAQNSCAVTLMVYLQTESPYRFINQLVELPTPTQSNPELVTQALLALRKIHNPLLRYRKAGVIITEITPRQGIQGNLFHPADTIRQHRLMKAIDTINHIHGRDAVRLAAQGYQSSWQMKRTLLSPRYSTNLNEIITINAK